MFRGSPGWAPTTGFKSAHNGLDTVGGMHQQRNRHARFRLLTLPAAALAAVLLLAGCAPGEVPEGQGAQAPETSAAPSTDGDTVNPPATPGDHDAVLSMAGQSFTFRPTVCMVTDEDVLVSGPGIDDDSQEPAWLDIDLYSEGSFREGGVRIDLGTDQQFSSSDSFFSANIGPGEEYLIMDDYGTLVIEATFRANGEASIGPGTFRIDCEQLG